MDMLEVLCELGASAIVLASHPSGNAYLVEAHSEAGVYTSRIIQNSNNNLDSAHFGR